MILLDANIFMYAAGSEHPAKAPSARLLEQVASGEGEESAIDAETLQEILHRYRAIDRWSDGRRVYDLARTIAPVTLPITAEILDHARALLDRYAAVMARDALHAAVAIEHTGGRIASFDTDFDRITELTRVEPSRIVDPPSS